jgi:hypothetical protein
MNVKYLNYGAILMMMLPAFAISQSSYATNNQNIFGTRYLGFQNNWGLSVRTDGITRMRFNLLPFYKFLSLFPAPPYD